MVMIDRVLSPVRRVPRFAESESRPRPISGDIHKVHGQVLSDLSIGPAGVSPSQESHLCN